MNPEPKKVFVAGHKGLVGSALSKKLSSDSQVTLVSKNRTDLDLLNQKEVHDFFCEEKFDEVYLAAAKVGGILANIEYPAEFIYQNTVIQNNVIDSSYKSEVSKLLFLGSSCIYPKTCKQPIREDYLLTNSLELSNEPYAIAKIAGIKTCEAYNRQYGTDFRSIMPTNLYGSNDNFSEKNGHVIPALMRRFHLAKIQHNPEIIVWGTGNAKRDFLHVDDLAEAAIHIMGLEKSIMEEITAPQCSHINVGSSSEYSIYETAEIIADVVGYKGKIVFDATKPDGTIRKVLDCSKIHGLGWGPKIDLREGLKSTYLWYQSSQL